MSKLEDTHHNLYSEFISLETQWVATRQAWRDQVGDRFEKEFWQPLEDQSSRYLKALREIGDALQQAEISTR